MKIGRESSFWKLYCDTKIKIPSIQRDYVQGRNNERINRNRSSFVREIVDSLCNNKKMTLNFIYGYYEEGDFIPIDGQQRLTTLFLLHFYVFSKAGHREEMLYKGKMNFSYETRYTTNRFFKELYKSDKTLLDNRNVKDAILDSSWYVYDWNNDPSVVSCLVMLEEIGKSFSKQDWEEYYNRLKSEDCPIKYMLLEMDKDQLGKPNQLYIRMNSRGKQLTDYENFKASLYSYIDDKKISSLSDLKDKIKNKIDGDWQSIIWSNAFDAENKYSEVVAEKYSDRFYRDLIHWIFINRMCIEEKLPEDLDWLKPKSKRIEDVYLESYIEIDENSIEKCVDDFYHTMFLFGEISKYKNEIVRQILSYSEDNKRNYYCQLSEYKQRVLLFAITRYAYAINNNPFNYDNFIEWFRIIKNLVNNTEIDDADSFHIACKSINNFSFSNAIANNPDKILELKGFKDAQLKEEVFKQQAINISTDWKMAILEAEKNDYFQGEILFSFPLYGITNISDLSSKKPLDYMNKWKDIEKIIGLASEEDVLFHRALLTYGDYSIQAPGGNGGAGVKTFYQFSEKHHNYDWRGMLRPEGNMQLGAGANLFKQFIDDCNGNDPKTVAINKINAYPKKNRSAYDNVLYYLVKHEKLFDYCKKNYYLWHDVDNAKWDRYLLMKTSVRNAYVEVNAFVVKNLSVKNIEIREGGNPYNEEDKRSYAVFGSRRIEYQKDCFVDENGNAYKDGSNNICDPEILVNVLKL